MVKACTIRITRIELRILGSWLDSDFRVTENQEVFIVGNRLGIGLVLIVAVLLRLDSEDSLVLEGEHITLFIVNVGLGLECRRWIAADDLPVYVFDDEDDVWLIVDVLVDWVVVALVESVEQFGWSDLFLCVLFEFLDKPLTIVWGVDVEDPALEVLPVTSFFWFLYQFIQLLLFGK